MDYSFYVVYRIEEGKKLTKFLDENHIKYEYDESIGFVNFNIAESSPF